MKSKPLAFQKIEQWVITFLFLIIILVNILNVGDTSFYAWGGDALEYFARVIIPMVFFLVFYILHIRLIPAYQKNKNLLMLIALCIPVAVISYVVISLFAYGSGITDTAFTPFYFKTLAIYGGYLVWVFLLKQVFLPPRMEDFKFYNSIRLGSIFFFVVLFMSQLSMLLPRSMGPIFTVILVCILVAVVFNYFLIYRLRKKGKTRAANIFNVLLVGVPSMGFIIGASAEGQPVLLLIGIGIALLLQLAVIPLSNLGFDRYNALKERIDNLSYQVDVGSANLSFLKSQINPHFLFNALNTLYGSALIENAEKTSDGIQKLGDMMRFMLHENQLDKIPLRREIEYLKNYLDLQMLRFSNEENLEVDIQLSDEVCDGKIAPMMLIPFVENAFKHGISTKNKSWIKINLRCLKGSIHLDVVNSIQPPKALEDPKDESGVGLENIRKRLQVMYPQKHELNIVANDAEHFVHFSLQLD